MRTTIRIDDALLAEAKARAARTGTTLNSVVENALRASFTERPERREPVSLPTFPGGRLQAGVDLDDSAALLELMEGSGS